MRNIFIQGACEGNLKRISVEIPREKLVVFTGLSGSGKSTLLRDVLYMECQRQYLEAMSFQGIPKPKVERVRGAGPAILISQGGANKNPRSTVGTATNIYTGLRMLFEKLGVRRCPACGQTICAADCVETTQKQGGKFLVWMDCCRCGHRMPKLTRSHFSFNTKEGACPACAGLGRVIAVDRSAAVNEHFSLEKGAVTWWERRYGEYQTGAFYRALEHYGLPLAPGAPVECFSALQKIILYQGVGSAAVQAAFPGQTPPRTVELGRFEGVEPLLWKRMEARAGDGGKLERCFTSVPCPACGGDRLNGISRQVTVSGMRLAQANLLSLDQLLGWIGSLDRHLAGPARGQVEPFLLDLETKLRRLARVGLGYLTPDRQTMTLSGGESQRLKLAATLDSDLTGLLYILDEPTAGLHPQDTAGMVEILRTLRDNGNTVLVIEHDPDVIRAADHLIDLGPGAGKQGGQVVACGTPAQLMRQPASLTGRWLAAQIDFKTEPRPGNGHFVGVRNAVLFNLDHLSVRFPCGCLAAVTGASGSGKSTLIFEVLAKGGENVEGLEQFSQVICLEQASISRNKRSNVATYSGAYDQLRALFAASPGAKAAGLQAKHFSFNLPGGRCETCQGLGTVASNLLFFPEAQVPCPACGGNRFRPDVLAVRCQGLSVLEVLALPLADALPVFRAFPKLRRTLQLLCDVGLGYLELGQPLTTLSGGEAQRLKLASELIAGGRGRTLYLLDEPTAGLHPQDVEHFLTLLDRMVDAGHTVIAVEHNQQLIRHCDWVVDLGPGGGSNGGELMFSGTPLQLSHQPNNATARYLLCQTP